MHQIDYRQFDKLDILAKQIVEGFIIGLHKSPYHGFSVEFAEYRSYNSGDSVRNIDWKTFAKTQKMYVKKYEEETNLRCQILIDTSSSMRYPQSTHPDELNKLEFSVVAAAALAYMLRKQRDAVGLTLASDHIELQTPAKTNAAHQQMIMNHLYQLVNHQDILHSKTDLSSCLHQMAEWIHKRSLVIIFSDFIERSDKMDEIFNAVQHLKHNKHEVVIFHVNRKKDEIDFQFENRPYEFIDMESGEHIKLQPHEVKDFYKQKVTQYIREVKNKFTQYQVDWVDADIDMGYSEILTTYLLKRKKMRI